ncbi:MAG TPA: peptidase T [Chitinophagaceae bacterium]|jgi:tripeptide aminopeptidase|nr:peptidase T [Chitinophagaceae bacterium]OPZ17673.1 MAG: Peptidase T [Bacteroidetes bacterium ADurb.BinA245]HNA19387.1 peptidase T [Chitinophagaceae bacterium]HNA91382.1 peptidase T [Chitinophagaceae bacterium]HND96524.1 peptidase T [Chitinophagaceae bacterium]
MFSKYQFTASERFMRYVQIDTQSDPQSNTYPSTEKQKDLGKILAAELLQMGLTDTHMDEWGYVYATIPSNVKKDVPVICFCAHMDTAPDCSGKNVKPILHKNFQGQDIVLPDDANQVISISEFPYLKTQIGNDIITASGTTLLGSDDKAGVAEIMDMANFLMTHPQVAHGTIKILFTPDEEVGRGVDKVDLKKLGADFGYTLDSGDAGALEDETFSADGVRVTIHGVISHPGYAKDKMINAMKIAGEVLAALPKDRLSPESTDGKKGFIHPVRVEGIAEKCTIDFIIRDFETAGLVKKEDYLRTQIEERLRTYPKASFEFKVTEQYRNMKEMLDLHPQVVAYAKEAIERAGLSVKMESIRGGTDGSRLSFMGLPCPNLFAGEQGIHSKLEHISVQDMNKAVETMVHLAQVWFEKS